MKASPKSLDLRDFRPQWATNGGVTVSTEMLAAKRHARVLAPVIVGKMIIANQQMAYAA